MLYGIGSSIGTNEAAAPNRSSPFLEIIEAVDGARRLAEHAEGLAAALCGPVLQAQSTPPDRSKAGCLFDSLSESVEEIRALSFRTYSALERIRSRLPEQTT